MGTPGAREGGGCVGFVPFGPVFYFGVVICTFGPIQVNSTYLSISDIFHHFLSQFRAFFQNYSKPTKSNQIKLKP